MKFRNDSGTIEAIQFTEKSKDRVYHFIQLNRKVPTWDESGNPALDIETMGVTMRISLGDYVIRGAKPGEYHICKPDIFEKTYEPVEA